MLPLTLSAAVPPGASAAIDLPFPRLSLNPDRSFPTNVELTEGGVAVWRGGAFVPGVAGVESIELVPPSWPLEWYSLRATVLAGQYDFEAAIAS